MSGRRSKKNQRIGSSRRGPKGLNRNIEKDDDDGVQQIAESGDGKNEFHTTSDYHSAQFDHPPSSSVQQTSALECPPHAKSHKDSLMETELPEGKRKMGSTRKSVGGFKVERKLDEVWTTEELDEYVSQPNISAIDEHHSSLRGDKQSSFPFNLSLQTEGSGLGGEPRATLMDMVSKNEEKDAIHHQEITSHSYEVVSATVSESDLLREDSVMFNKLNPLSHQETPLASTTGQKRRMGSTRRPLGGKNSENVGVQEHSRSMTKNERKAEVIDEAKFSMSEEMAQMWDDVVRDDPSSHTETSLVSNQSLLAERAELKEPDVSSGTETMNQSVAFPLVNPEKPLPETSSHNGTPLLNKGLDFKFGSHTEDFDVLNKVLEDDNQHVPNTRNDTNTSHDCSDINTVEGKEEVLKQKEEPSRNKKTSSLSPRHDAQLEELVLNCEESPPLSQHTAQLIEGGNISFDIQFDVSASNISHAEPTATNSPHEMSDAVDESQEIYVEMKHEYNVCDVASITYDTLTDLECADEDERGSETDNGFEITDQSDARDNNVTQIIMEATNNKGGGGTSTETIWISHQELCEVSNEKEELHREQEFSSTIPQTQSGPPQDNARKMLENKFREDQVETENTVITDVTSKSEEMISFEDSATETGSHAHQQLFMQSPDKEGYDLSEKSENAAFDGRSEETEGSEGMNAALLILDVEKPLTNVNTVHNNSESDLQTENPEQNRILTEEQNDTSHDINQEAFQVSNNVSAVIDSSPLLHVAICSEETDTNAEESDISLVIPEDSHKLTTFYSETQVNEGDTEIVPVGGDTDIEIQTENKSFYSSISEAVGTEENSHDVSVLVREFDVTGDTVTVESNRTTESDFLQTSSEALKVSENPENEVSSDISIVPEDSHREKAQTKLSPVVYKRKMGSTRRPLRGDTGQRKRRDDENETFNSESMINAEKETFGLEDEPSPVESTTQSSNDGAKEQEMEISEKNDVGPVEGSESDLMQSLFSLDSVSKESTAVTISHLTESQTLTKMNQEAQENTGDVERVPAEGDTQTYSEIQTENKMTNLTTSEAERAEENILDATVLVGEVEFTVDTVTVESNMSESDLLQNDTFTDPKLEALKVSENTENVSSVTDTGLLMQDDVTDGSGETDTIPDQSDTNIIPEDTHREEAHSKSSPAVHKRKMGSTRRPLRGDTRQIKRREYDDENETCSSESMINVQKETFSPEDEPSPDESTSQSSKDGAKEQEMEISEKNDVGPVEGSESDLMQSSFSLDSVSEESTAVSISHITGSQTLTKMIEETDNAGDAERVPAKGDTQTYSEIQTENKTTNLTTSEAERAEENILDATVLVGEVEFTVDTVTVESNMSESDLLQNDTFTDPKLEALKVSENTENVSSVTDTGLLMQDDVTDGSGETDTISDQSDTNIIPEDTHREEAHSKSSPIVHKRKMGSTRRPLRGDTRQRKRREYDDENETFISESMINVQKETFSPEDEPSPDESTSQSSKDGAKEQEMEISEKNDVGPVEGSESDLMQSLFSLDSVSEESTAVSISHITESQTLTKMIEETDNAGAAERVPAEGDTQTYSEIQTENKTTNLTTSEAERAEENILDATVLVGEVEFTVDTVTVESNMSESDLLQNDTFTDPKLEALKVSENTENVSSVTDTGLLMQDDVTDGSGETDTIPDQSDTNIIPEDTHREEAHSKSSPIVHKRKMGSTRRPLRGDTRQRKRREYDDENETFISESMINVQKETFSPEDEPSPDESTSQSSKDGAKEQEMEISEKNDVGPVEGSESDLMQSSFSLDSVSEESTAVSISHITESQTLTKMIEETDNAGAAERVPAEGDTQTHSEIQTENKTIDLTSEAEGTEENIYEATVLVKEVEVIGDTVTVESDMTTKSDFHQNVSSPDAHVEDLKVSKNVENKVSGETDTTSEPSDINIIPEGSHREEVHVKPSPFVHKRKMGSTRRPLRGDTGQRKGREHYDELETFSSESMINVETETFSPEDEHSPDKSTSQSSKDGAKEQEMEISEKNDVGPVEGSESDLMQSSFSLDSVSEESTAVTISPITESQTLTKMIEETDNAGDAERVPAKGDTQTYSEMQTENKTTNLTTSEAERAEENILDATVLVGEVEFTVDTVTVESNMSESDLLQNDTFTDPKLEALKVSENTENVSSVTDTGLLMQDDVTDGSGETDTIPDQSDTNIIPEDTHREEAHSKSSPAVHKRKMGSTRRPLRGDTRQIKRREYDDENETFSSERDAESHSEIQTENKTIHLTSEAEGTEENIYEATVLVKEIEAIGDRVTVDSDMTTKSDFHQNVSFPDAHVEDLKVSENVENKVSGETDTTSEPSDINIIPEGSHREEVHAKPSPVVHKRKMGSTRRPLRGDTGQRKIIEHHDENETFSSEHMINVEKETFSLEDEPSPVESTTQSSKDGAKEQESEISEKNDVGPVEGSESDLMQSSFSLDSVSEESTAVTISHLTESQTLTKMNQESQENTGDAERVPAEGDTQTYSEIQTENKTTNLTTSEAERAEENILDATVLVGEVEFTVDTVTVESNMSESDLLQNDTFTDPKLEALKVSEKNENVSSVIDTGHLLRDDVTDGSGETDTISDQSDTNIIPEDTHREEVHVKPSPVVHKRKMGSTRRPLRGDTGQRKRREHHDENETFSSESMISVEKETFSLEDEPSRVESTTQSSKDRAKEQDMEISEKNDIGPVEGSESDLMQSSFSLDSVSEESTAVSISHITESQTLTKMTEETDNAGAAERVAVGGDTDICFEIKAQNKVEVTGNTVTVESDITTKSDFHQNVSSPDAHVEDLKVSENVENKVSGETDTTSEPSDINIIPEGSHREEVHVKPSPVVHKRKMGSTRRPLRGDTGQRKRREHHDENETFSSESMISVEKETFSLEDEPSPVESTTQSSKDRAKEQDMEISENNDVGPVEGSESDLMQSSFSLDSVSEESTAVSISHITGSQTLTKMNEESQENTGDAERVPAEGDAESHSEIQTENKTIDLTSEAEVTEENIYEATVLVKEIEAIGDRVTVDSDMTTKSDFHQNVSSPDAHVEDLKVSENVENKVSGETDTTSEPSDINIIPEGSHREEVHVKSSPVVHKRKMGSTRRPLRGDTGQRKRREYDDENETFSSECMIKVEKETFSLEDEPSPDESTTQSSKDGAKEQEMEISEKNDVGPVEGSESDLMQSSFSLDSVSEESTAVSISHITESQTLTKMIEETDNAGAAERVAVGGDTDICFEIKAQNKVEVTGNTVTVESYITTKSDFHQNVSSPDAHVEDLKVSENVENKVSGETDTTSEPSDINIIPEGSHREEVHAKPSPVVHKRKMGSTRRPLRGDTGQRKRREHHDENETFSSESMINVEKETFSLEDEPSPVESTTQSSKDRAKEQDMEISEKNDVGPVEGSESDLMQSSFSLDSVSEESTAVSISHITGSQTLTKMNEESQENTGDAERVPAEGDAESHSEIQTENKTIDLTSEAEGTEENIFEATVLVKEIEAIGDTVTVESDMTTKSDFHQNVSSPDAHVEDLKVSENVENKVSGETETTSEPSDINIIPEGSHREEVHAKPSPVVHKRKMGSTRRPLRGNTGQRKEREYHDEKGTFSSESMINVVKETFSLEDEPSPVESSLQSSNDAQKLIDVKLDSLKVSENTENVSSVTDTGSLVQDDATEGYCDVTTKSDFHQNASSPDAHMEELNVSENAENKVSRQTDINIIPEDFHREEVHTKLSPIVHKRKIGSTRKPLRGNKGQRKGEEDTETVSEFQDQDHNVRQGIMNIRDDEDEERMTTKLVGMSVQLCDDLEQEQRSAVSQTQTGPSQDDTGSHSSHSQFPERTADFVRDSLSSHSDLVLSDALLMEETQINVSSEDAVMGGTCVPPAEVVEMHSVSNRSLQKRKIGSTRKRGKRMVNEEEVEEEKEGEAENTTIDDGTTKSEETLTLGEAITGSLVHQQAFSSSAGKEGHDIQGDASKSEVQTENSEQNDQKQAGEIVSDLPLGDVETNLVPEQSEILSIIPEESHRKDVQSNSIPVVQKRKMGSTRKTLRGNKGQRREAESKKMDGESKGIAVEQDTDPHLAISEREYKWKLDEDIEQNFPVEFSHQAAISNMFSESEDGVKEISLNIHDPSEVSVEKGMENTVNDNNSLNEAINLYEGTMDTFVLTVSHEDVHQTMSADYLDQHVHGGSKLEQTETMCHVFPMQELKNTQDDIVHENSSQKIACTKEKRRKIGSTRRNPRVMHGKDMGDQDDILGMAIDRETKKAEDDLDDMPLASIISQPKEMSSEAVSTTDLQSEMFVKGGENDYQNSSDPSGPETPENTLQICENQLVSADVTKHLQPETVTVEKRRKMGSTRKNVREGRIRGKRDAYDDTETADTHLTMSQDSEMSLVGKAVGEQKIHNYSNQSEDSLLSEIERALNTTSQSSLNYELIGNEPNSGDFANTPYLNKLENSEIKSLQLQPSQTSKTHSEPNSPERRRRKMGSTRRNPRHQLKAEREDEDKEDREVEENSVGNKQEMKNLERVEVSVMPNIPENKLNKEYLDVPSAHTNSSQLEESGNPVVQERTSPSTKRKFGSRRTNKGKQGLGRMDASNRSELEDEVIDDLTVCDPYHTLQPENQPISQPISEKSNMEARNEAAPKGTGAGLVSLDQIVKHDRSTVSKQTINLKNRNTEVQFNVVMVGNSCVGKTSFIRRFHEGQFTEDYRSTIGVDTCLQTVVLPDRTVKLQIWDTAGQERFHSITRQVFHKADGVLLMYEITCSKSFISVRDWISQARERAPDDAIMILLGNKSDSVEREVQIQEGVDLAREYNIGFMECSAATGANVSESMRSLAELLVQRKTRKEEHITLRREPPPKKSGCC